MKTSHRWVAGLALALLGSSTSARGAAGAEFRCEEAVYGVEVGYVASVEEVCRTQLQPGRYELRTLWTRGGSGAFEVEIGPAHDALWLACGVFAGEESCHLEAHIPITYTRAFDDDLTVIGRGTWITIESEATLVYSVGLLRFSEAECDCFDPLNTNIGAGRFVLGVSDAGPADERSRGNV